ncbi:Shikimate kinase [Bythopirellula polymerisocia]|uniref:Shikimate kinase n=2 Tax=Bythopirellula polymerisocia TaxID=2528003 RepID=A0A5C6CMD7_9BACT|nr:Shikimate kinase [Bythopirellula polymerisocia]
MQNCLARNAAAHYALNMPPIDTRPIALIGLRGTGKTTVAQLLALRVGWDWVDADVEVELRAGKSIAAIFADDGETEFRDQETEVVAELCERAETVLALGGGAVLREANRRCLANCQAVVWLQASPETLARRLEADATTPGRRPNLTNHGGRTEIDALLAEREVIYRGCATLEVDTEEKQPAEIAEEIFAALGG